MVGKRRRAIQPPLVMGEQILLWLRLALNPHERHTVLDRFIILWMLDLRPVRPPPPPDFRLGRICLLHRPEEILDDFEGPRRDCRRGVHCRPHRRRLALSHTFPHALTVLEISHSLSNQVRISFNLANFAWSPSAIRPICCCILSIDVLLRGLVLALEDGRRDGGLAIEKRKRRDGSFAMEKMERRGGGFAMEKRERRDGGFGMEMMERRGGGFAMEKSERSVRHRFRIEREG